MSTPNWHKSSYSSGSSDNCIEVADNQPGHILIRDTKDHAKGILAVTPEAWQAFASFVGRARSSEW